MKEFNIEFFEVYTKLDRMCCDMYSCDKGITTYNNRHYNKNYKYNQKKQDSTYTYVIITIIIVIFILYGIAMQ